MLASPQVFVHLARNNDDIRSSGMPDTLSCIALPLSSIAESVRVVETHPSMVHCDLV